MTGGSIGIDVMHCGSVCVSPYLPFGGDDCGILRASGLTTRKEDRIWLPVSSYLIRHPEGMLLFDCGWHREISPGGTYDRRAQIRHMSRTLYMVNQGILPEGEAVDEQLARRGISPEDLDCVILSHLDVDHASGLKLVRDAKRILVSEDEVRCAKKHRVRYASSMWEGVDMETFSFDETGIGPFGRSKDLFGDGTVQMVSIPGHSDGQIALRIANGERFVLLFADGGYATRSWKEMIRPGISMDPERQMASLRWIREQSLDPNCVESLANHDPDVAPHSIELRSAHHERRIVPRDHHIGEIPDAVDALQRQPAVRAEGGRLALLQVPFQRYRIPGADVAPVGLDENAGLLGAMAGGVDHPHAGTDLELVLLDDPGSRDLRLPALVDQDLRLRVPLQVPDVVAVRVGQNDRVDVLREDPDLPERGLDGGPHVLRARVDHDVPPFGPDERGGGMRLDEIPVVVALQEPYAEDVELYHGMSHPMEALIAVASRRR